MISSCTAALSRLQPLSSIKHAQSIGTSRLVIRSHIFQTRFSPSIERRSRPSVRTTSNRHHLKGVAQSRRILEWLAATGLAIGKQSTSFAHCERQPQMGSIRLVLEEGTTDVSLVSPGFPYPKSVYPEYRRVDNSVQRSPAIRIVYCGGILDSPPVTERARGQPPPYRASLCACGFSVLRKMLLSYMAVRCPCKDRMLASPFTCSY
jgi:hypothetical protein